MAQYVNPANGHPKSESKEDPADCLKDEVDIEQIITGCKEKGAKQYQEDSYFQFESPDMTFLVAGVFDGHGGINGRVASQKVAELSTDYFSSNWQKCKGWKDEEWTTEMTSFYHHLHQKVRDQFVQLETSRRKNNKLPTTNIEDRGVVRKSSGFPIHGGTTCTIVCIIRTKTKWRIVCSNTGDSDALLLSRKPSRLPHDNNKCKHLSVDHSPDNADEYLRIKNLPTDQFPTKLLFVYDQANTCRKFECPIVFLEDGTKDPKYVKNPWGNHLRPTNVRYDPAVYAVSPYGVSHDITCIAMTRSLGDFYAHQFGLSNVPSVTFEELDIWNAEGEANEFIVTVGSDGIWDCWKWDDWSDYVNGVMTKCKSELKKVCESVLKHTIQRAKACFGEGSYDDASLVLVALRPELFKVTNSGNNDAESAVAVEEAVESGKGKESNIQSASQSPANELSVTDDLEEKEEANVKGLDDEEEEQQD